MPDASLRCSFAPRRRRDDARNGRASGGLMATVRVEDRSGGVRVLTLDRPPANAEDVTLLADLSAALDDAGADSRVRAVVLTGAGKFFSGGFDLATTRAGDDEVAVLTTLFRDTHVKLLTLREADDRDDERPRDRRRLDPRARVRLSPRPRRRLQDRPQRGRDRRRRIRRSRSRSRASASPMRARPSSCSARRSIRRARRSGSASSTSSSRPTRSRRP